MKVDRSRLDLFKKEATWPGASCISGSLEALRRSDGQSVADMHEHLDLAFIGVFIRGADGHAHVDDHVGDPGLSCQGQYRFQGAGRARLPVVGDAVDEVLEAELISEQGPE